MTLNDPHRRVFLTRALTALGAVLLGGPAGTMGRALAARRVESLDPPANLPRVYEIRLRGLRGGSGETVSAVLEESVYVAATALTRRDLLPLDALSELFPDDPPVVILVDPRFGASTTRVIATRLSGALVDMGSAAESIVVVGSTDEEMGAAGYTVTRSGKGPFCRGLEPDGYGKPVSVPGTRSTVRLTRAIEDPAARLAVVARLSASDRGMGPFVIDAALHAVDEDSRARAKKDPGFGARLLASPLLAGRVGLVFGDLVEIPLIGGEKNQLEDEGAETRSPAWKADEVLAGTNVLAMERIGHTILSNTCLARGLPAPAPHPILAEAAKLGSTGAKAGEIDWRKGAA